MMSSAETWYGLRKQEIDQMEEVDKMLIRKILDAPISFCIESLYLELGIIPIHILLKARRINYFHYLVNLKEDEILYKLCHAQFKYPNKNDWTIQVQQDLDDFGLPESFQFMKSKSSNSLKTTSKNSDQRICPQSPVKFEGKAHKDG